MRQLADGPQQAVQDITLVRVQAGLDELLNRCFEHAARLREKLEPVLRPDSPCVPEAGSAVAPAVAVSPAINTIQIQAMLVMRIIDTLTDMICRLQVQ